MPVKRYVVGTGLTKRLHTKVELFKSADPDELAALDRIFSKDYSFEGQVKDKEEWAIEVLEEAGLPTDGKRGLITEIQSRQWYANEILRYLKLIRAINKRVAAGEGDEANALVLFAFTLGFLIQEARFKLYWEQDILRGIKTRARNRRNLVKARKNLRKRNDFIRARANEYRNEGKRSASEIARHIENRAMREAERADGDNVDSESTELWARTAELSQHTIRGIISKKVE